MITIPQPRYYYTDKDISDFLARCTPAQIRNVGKHKRMHFSEATTKPEMIHQLSRLIYSHSDIHFLCALGAEQAKTTETPFKFSPPAGAVEAQQATVTRAMTEVKAAIMAELPASKITATPTSVTVVRQEMDPGKSALKQCREIEGTLTVDPISGKVLKGTCTDNKIGADLYAKFREVIKKADQTIKEEPAFELKDLSHAQRTDFFTSLLKLPSLSFVKVSSVELAGNHGDKVERLAMAGKNVLESDEYKKLVGQNLGIHSLEWEALSQSKEWRLQISAGRSKEQNLTFSVKASPVDVDGKKARQRPTNGDATIVTTVRETLLSKAEECLKPVINQAITSKPTPTSTGEPLLPDIVMSP